MTAPELVLLLVVRFPPAFRTGARKDGVMTGDREPALLFGDVPRDQRHWHIDIEQQTAAFARHMVVAIGPGIVATGLIGEGELLDQTMLGEEMQRSINRAIGDPGIALAHALEDFASRQVAVSLLNNAANHFPLCGFAKRRFHRSTALLNRQRAS